MKHYWMLINEANSELISPDQALDHIKKFERIKVIESRRNTPPLFFLELEVTQVLSSEEETLLKSLLEREEGCFRYVLHPLRGAEFDSGLPIEAGSQYRYLIDKYGNTHIIYEGSVSPSVQELVKSEGGIVGSSYIDGHSLIVFPRETTQRHSHGSGWGKADGFTTSYYCLPSGKEISSMTGVWGHPLR